MAEISVGGAVNEGFQIIRHRPFSVFLWGLTQMAIAAAAFAVLIPVYYAMFVAFRSGAGLAAMQTVNPQVMQMRSISYLIDLVQVIISSIIWCAVFRSVLHPERGQFAFLRLGASEFFVAVLLIGGYFAFVVGLVFAVIIAAIVIGFLVVMHLVWAAVIVGVAAAIAAMVALVYVGLRFSMVGPMIVDDGQFHLGESWALTRGNVGSLLMIGLLLFVLAIVAQIVLGILLVGIGAGGLAVIAGGLQNLPTLFLQPLQVLLARLGPLLILAAVIWIPFVGCLSTIMAAPWARAYRDLKPPDLAATFA